VVPSEGRHNGKRADDRGDATRLSTRSSSRGERVAGMQRSARGLRPTAHGAGRNAANLMTGCGVQQTRIARMEQAVKAGRNREGGT
jgi:hypothetical protein